VAIDSPDQWFKLAEIGPRPGEEEDIFHPVTQALLICILSSISTAAFFPMI
jgi:hypothetical protein